MTNTHELTVDYQIKQARRVKHLTAQNGQLRCERDNLLEALELLMRATARCADVPESCAQSDSVNVARTTARKLMAHNNPQQTKDIT